MRNMDLITKQFRKWRQTMPTIVDRSGRTTFEMTTDDATIQFLIKNGSCIAYIWFNTIHVVESYEERLNNTFENLEPRKWREGIFEIYKMADEEGDYFEVKYLENNERGNNILNDTKRLL